MPCPPPNACRTPPRGEVLKPAEAEEMESLIAQLRALPRGDVSVRAAQSRLAVLTRPHVQRAADAVAREFRAPVEDLLQEGLLATFDAWQRFTPGKAGPGRSLYPAYVLKLARQAMKRAAVASRSPVHVTRHARRAVTRAKKTAREEGRPLAEVMREAGVSEDAVRALGDGTIRAALPADALLSLADGAGEKREARDAVAQAVAALYRLPRVQRHVLMAHVGLGRARPVKDRELAAELAQPVAFVQEQRTRAVRHLQRLLEAR